MALKVLQLLLILQPVKTFISLFTLDFFTVVCVNCFLDPLKVKKIKPLVRQSSVKLMWEPEETTIKEIRYKAR